MATFRAVILKGENHLKIDNTTNIKIRVTHNRKADYISTDLFINPVQLKNGQATGDNAAFINMRITDSLQIYQRRYLELGNMSVNMTAKELKNEISKDKSEGINFMKLAEDYRKQLIIEGKQGSERAVRGLLASLKKYKTNILFSDITANFLDAFENFMIKNGVGAGGIETYMSRFRLIFNLGRDFYNDEDRGIIRIKNYPFKKYKVTKPKDKGKPKNTAKNNCLNMQHLKMFIDYKPVNRRELLAQNTFLLMICLIGSNSKDLFHLPKPTRDGRISYNRFKTGKEFSIYPYYNYYFVFITLSLCTLTSFM